MKELVGRLSLVDPEAGAAVGVIAYFDELLARRAGLESVVGGAAYLAGCTARLVDEERRLRIRISPSGEHLDGGAPTEPGWPAQEVGSGNHARIVLERGAGDFPLDPMILERAAAAAGAVMERTRDRRGRTGDDPALVELLLDGSASEHERLAAARRLGLGDRARAIAVQDGPARVVPAAGPVKEGPRRTGIGPAVPPLDLPASWRAAVTALRFTAEGTERDPGPRSVDFDDLGVLALLADRITPGDQPPADVQALDRAATEAPWMLSTLDVLALSPSLRAAAKTLAVHHSTLQNRLTQAEKLLTWPLDTPAGRLRLQLALIARRLLHSP